LDDPFGPDSSRSDDGGKSAGGRATPNDPGGRRRSLPRPITRGRTSAGGNSEAIKGAAAGRSGVARRQAKRSPPAGTEPSLDEHHLGGSTGGQLGGSPNGSRTGARNGAAVLAELHPVRFKAGRSKDGRLGEGPQRRDPEELALPSGDDRPDTKRRPTTWRIALNIGLLCFAVWLLLDAPTLMNSASGSPLGARRTVAMDILRPIAWLSRVTGLTHVVGAADRVLGRDGSGAVSISSGPSLGSHLHSAPPTVPPTTVVTTKSGRHVVKPVVLSDGWPPFPPFSASNPLRVLIVGDSVGTDLGQYALVDDLGSTGVVSATLDGQISTGLTRPDYFNWPAELEVDLARYHPQLTVICIGANDPQNTIVNGQVLTYGTQAWNDIYSERVGSFIREATSAGSRVLWVGMPPMADPVLNSQMRHLDDIYASEVKLNRGSTYLSSVPALGGPGGTYAAFKTVDGSSEEIRTDDGIHLQPAGAQLLAVAVIQEMDAVYHLKLRP